jgi:hypothetical protein
MADLKTQDPAVRDGYSFSSLQEKDEHEYSSIRSAAETATVSHSLSADGSADNETYRSPIIDFHKKFNNNSIVKRWETSVSKLSTVVNDDEYYHPEVVHDALFLLKESHANLLPKLIYSYCEQSEGLDFEDNESMDINIRVDEIKPLLSSRKFLYKEQNDDLQKIKRSPPDPTTCVSIDEYLLHCLDQDSVTKMQYMYRLFLNFADITLDMLEYVATKGKINLFMYLVECQLLEKNSNASIDYSCLPKEKIQFILYELLEIALLHDHYLVVEYLLETHGHIFTTLNNITQTIAIYVKKYHEAISQVLTTTTSDKKHQLQKIILRYLQNYYTKMKQTQPNEAYVLNQVIDKLYAQTDTKRYMDLYLYLNRYLKPTATATAVDIKATTTAITRHKEIQETKHEIDTLEHEITMHKKLLTYFYDEKTRQYNNENNEDGENRHHFSQTAVRILDEDIQRRNQYVNQCKYKINTLEKKAQLIFMPYMILKMYSMIKTFYPPFSHQSFYENKSTVTSSVVVKSHDMLKISNMTLFKMYVWLSKLGCCSSSYRPKSAVATENKYDDDDKNGMKKKKNGKNIIIVSTTPFLLVIYSYAYDIQNDYSNYAQNVCTTIEYMMETIKGNTVSLPSKPITTEFLRDIEVSPYDSYAKFRTEQLVRDLHKYGGDNPLIILSHIQKTIYNILSNPFLPYSNLNKIMFLHGLIAHLESSSSSSSKHADTTTHPSSSSQDMNHFWTSEIMSCYKYIDEQFFPIETNEEKDASNDINNEPRETEYEQLQRDIDLGQQCITQFARLLPFIIKHHMKILVWSQTISTLNVESDIHKRRVHDTICDLTLFVLQSKVNPDHIQWT